ncbi:MAG: hypothetical protein CM1200mP20_02800 [Pseudomonadota bacterium]|nr:MAG: hypothetical protein CM1200mP20_02800 [Pseudomonadota bacterium]
MASPLALIDRPLTAAARALYNVKTSPRFKVKLSFTWNGLGLAVAGQFTIRAPTVCTAEESPKGAILARSEKRAKLAPSLRIR